MGEEAARHLGEDASLVIWYASLPTVSTPDGWKTGVVDFHVGLAWVESTNLDIEGEFLVREGVWVPQAPSVEEIEPPIFNSHVGRKSARSWAGQISSRLADACLG